MISVPYTEYLKFRKNWILYTRILTKKFHIPELKWSRIPCTENPLPGLVSTWVDEMEDQRQKRKSLNEAAKYCEWSVQPLFSTLNTSWDDISNTQERHYIRKVTEAIPAKLSVICPGQENQIWSTLRKAPVLLESQNPGGSSEGISFNQHSMNIDAWVKAFNAAESWQTKRQILPLFANDFSRAELQQMVLGLSKWRIDPRQRVIHTGQDSASQNSQSSAQNLTL